MDTLVKEALSRVNQKVEAIPWDRINDLNSKVDRVQNALDYSEYIADSIRAIHALESVLKSL